MDALIKQAQEKLDPNGEADLVWDMLEFDQFMRNMARVGRGNGWFNGRTFQVYCRLTKHYLNGQTTPVFDLANINVNRSGCGVFKRLVIHYQYSWARLGLPPILRVESVLTERFAQGLLKMGFVQQKDTNPPSFTKDMT